MTRLLQLLTITGIALYTTFAMAALKPDISAQNIRDFTRVTFNWPEKIRFRVEPFNSGVTLIFSQPTDINLSQIKSNLGTLLTRSSQSADGTRVTLNFNKPYRVRHFISGNANGIDILGASAAPKPAEPPKAPPAQETANTNAKAKTKPEPLIRQPLPETTPETQEPDPQEAPSEEAETPPATAPQPANEPAEPEALAETEIAAPASTEEEAEAPAEQAEETEVAEVTQAEAPEAEAAEENTPESTEEPAPIDEAPSATSDKSNLPDSAQDNPFLITTYSLATGTEIRFPWVQRTGASVFMRGTALWVVFNNEQYINMEMLRSILPASILDVQQVDVPGHLVMRFETDGTVSPKIHQPKSTAQWWLTLSRYKQIPAEVIELEPRTGATIPDHLYISELQYDKPVTFADPMIGDEITAVPFYTPGRGIYPARNFPEVTLLPSAQGVAMVKKDDFAEIRQLRNGFRITSRDGLSLSDNLPKLELAELESIGDSITWFPYTAWAVEPEAFIDTRRDLEAQLADASDVRANSLRLKLAQLHLGQGMGNEALAWLKLIEENNPSFFKERDLIALRGAAHFINDDYMLAKDAFMDEALRGESELKLWMQALKVFEEERPRFDFDSFYKTYISKYPPKMQEKLAIIAADNYINRRSYNRALKTLNILGAQDNLDPRTESYVYFLLGKIAAENENFKGAKELWEPLLAVDSPRFVRATTQFALTSMLYNNNEITLKEAIERLESVRIVWRGDALEMTLLNYLGQLYMADENYLMALRTWRELVQNFPDAPLAITVASQMATAFNELYAEGKAEELAPLDALAVFYEFRDLTPIGEAGDIMIQLLADRLVAVDLLDRAAALIEHQIRFRQEKLARSKLGTRLAMIYLMGSRPEKAVETLELTGYGDMPEALAEERQRIAAMGMLATNEEERALEMLANDDSREADRLRLHIYWQMRDWDNVIANGEKLLGNRPDVTAPLTEAETEQLLQLSIAYMFERNTVQLQYLRNYFMPLLPEGPNKELFAYVSSASGELNPQEFETLAGDIANFENFIQSYDKQVKEGGLSPVLN